LKVKDLRVEVEALTLKLNEHKKSSKMSFDRAQEAVNSLKIENEAKIVLEKLVKALEEQVKQQTEANAVAKKEREQSREGLEQKINAAMQQSSASDKQTQEMKAALEKKTLDAGILSKKVESLTIEIETSKSNLKNLREKVVQAENELRDKTEMFGQNLKEQMAEVNKHKEMEKRSEENLRSSKAEVEKLASSLPSLKVELEAKSNTLDIAKREVIELTEKVRHFESANSALESTVEKMKAESEAKIEYLSKKEANLFDMQTKVSELEETNQKLAHELSSQQLTFKAKITEKEQNLISQEREQDRKNSGQEQLDLEILQKTEKTLLEAKAEIADLETRLKREKTTSKEEVEEHQAEIIGYEEAVDEKNKTIRNLTEELSAIKRRASSSLVSGHTKDFRMLLEKDQTRLPTSI